MSAPPIAGDGGVSMEVDLTIYPLDAVLRTCHTWTDRCYVFVRRVDATTVAIDVAARDTGRPLHDIVGELSNALLDNTLRAIVADETRAIRELLVAEAFCEADLLDRRDSESDEAVDPRRIAG